LKSFITSFTDSTKVNYSISCLKLSGKLQKTTVIKNRTIGVHFMFSTVQSLWTYTYRPNHWSNYWSGSCRVCWTCFYDHVCNGADGWPL